MRSIVLMPVRNDAWFLDVSLSCLSQWADHIILADQNSTDDTLEICKRYPKVTVIRNEAKFHSTKVRQLLLDEARKIPGNNCIYSIDSDEILTCHILSSSVRGRIEKLAAGSSVELQWVNLWGSPTRYRNDTSVWSNSWKSFIFLDDRVSNYEETYILNDHNPRVPPATLKHMVRMEFPKVLHFQFVNPERMLSKQRYYRVQDFVQGSKSLFSAVRINFMYFPTKLKERLVLADVPAEWTQPYLDSGIDVSNFRKEKLFWYDIEVLKMFKNFCFKTFSWLDIWDVDWEELKRMAFVKNAEWIPSEKLTDPRNVFIKAYQGMQYFLAKAHKVYYRVKKFFYAKK